MTYLSACMGCAANAQKCPTRESIRAAVRGRHVTSIRHRCADRIPLYAPGAPVLVKTSAWLSRDQDEDYSNPPKLWFPGHFIRQKGSSAIAFIKPDTRATDDAEQSFETTGQGFVKVPFSRLKHSAGGLHIPMDECSLCGRIAALIYDCNLEPPDCRWKAESAPVRGRPT